MHFLLVWGHLSSPRIEIHSQQEQRRPPCGTAPAQACGSSARNQPHGVSKRLRRFCLPCVFRILKASCTEPEARCTPGYTTFPRLACVLGSGSSSCNFAGCFPLLDSPKAGWPHAAALGGTEPALPSAGRESRPFQQEGFQVRISWKLYYLSPFPGPKYCKQSTNCRSILFSLRNLRTLLDLCVSCIVLYL